MVRSFPRKLNILVAEPIPLHGFNQPASTPFRVVQEGWYECEIHNSPNQVTWILFPQEHGSNQFGLHIHLIWMHYEKGALDFEAGGEDGFLEKKELEAYLKSYITT